MQERKPRTPLNPSNSLGRSVWSGCVSAVKFVWKHRLKIGVSLLTAYSQNNNGAEASSVVVHSQPLSSNTCPSYNNMFNALQVNYCPAEFLKFKGEQLASGQAQSAASFDSSVDKFVQSQAVIRIFAVGVGGHGHVAATHTVMEKLRKEFGYEGDFEVIYPARDAQVVATVFGLMRGIPSVFSDKASQITFITLEEQIKRIRNHEVAPLTLGMSGAADDNDPSCDWANKVSLKLTTSDTDMCRNIAKLLNVNVYASVTHHPHDKDYGGVYSFQPGDELMLLKDNSKRHIVTKPGTFFVAPPASLEQAKSYLQMDPSVLLRTPALATYIEGLEEGNFDVMSVYGRSLKDEKEPDNNYLANMLQVITGVRHAQRTNVSPNQPHQPTIVAVYYNFENESARIKQFITSDNFDLSPKPKDNLSAKEAAQKALLDGIMADFRRSMGLLLQPQKQNNSAWVEKAKNAVQEAGLNEPGVFLTASLSDPNAGEVISSLKPNQVLLLSMGSLPKKVFDGLFTHTGAHVLAALREGYSTLSLLLRTGLAHFICSNSDIKRWDVGFDLVENEALRKQLTTFYRSGGFCHGEISWINSPSIWKDFGDLLNQARMPESSFSRYFQSLRAVASAPENDRVRHILTRAMLFSRGDSAALGSYAVDLPEWKLSR